MITKLDINLLALARQAGKDQTGLPGFYAVSPPRRTARGRADDSLIILLSCTGGAPFPTNLQEQWFERMSQAYFQTPGSTTAAMRTAAQVLNQQLFDRALRGAGTRQGLGLLTLAVMRSEQIFLAQCGPQHAFVFAPDRLDHFYDLENAGSGLGVARTVAIRFFQSPLHPEEYVLVTHQLPPGWDDATLQSAYGQGLESLRRQLLSAAGTEVNAILVQVQAGHGHMRLLKPKPAPPSSAAETSAQPGPAAPAGPPIETRPSVPAATDVLVTPPPQTEAQGPEDASVAQTEVAGTAPAESAPAGTATAAPTAEADTGSAQPPFPAEPPVPVNEQQTAVSISIQPSPAPSKPQTTPERASAASRQPSTAGSSSQATGARRLNDRTPSKPIRPRKTFLSILAAPLRKVVSGAGHTVGRTGRAAAGGLRLLIKRLLPDEGLFHLPPSTMIFFAVAIPLIIAIVGGMMYLERGRTQQYQKYYDQAFDIAIQAGQLQDPAQQRAAWGLVLIDLDTAETFRTTADSKALRMEAQQALDQNEHVTRIDLQPAIRGNLDNSVQVSRIVATDEELYLLNAARGNVMRALYTTRGYEVDTSFRCGKGTYGTIVVGPPLGLVPLPKGNTDNADILAMDENGNRVYCGPGSNLPMAKRVTLPPEWKKPSAITLNPDNLNLYALDIPANQVWIFQKKQDGEDLWPFFAEEETRNLADVIDISAASGDLFLLHANGQVSRCTYGQLEEIPARCVPLTFTGLPGGRADGNSVEGVQFWQVVYAPPPGPSLYLLDASNQAILHFSLLGNFQTQYRSKNPLPTQPAVALAISPRRSVFIAVGNQVYFTNIP
jgi:hypothetical protein